MLKLSSPWRFWVQMEPTLLGLSHINHVAKTIALVQSSAITTNVGDVRQFGTPIIPVEQLTDAPVVRGNQQTTNYALPPPLLVGLETSIPRVAAPPGSKTSLLVDMDGRYHVVSQLWTVIVVLLGLGVNSHVSVIRFASWVILDASVTVPVGSSLLVTVIEPSILKPPLTSYLLGKCRIVVFAIKPAFDVVNVDDITREYKPHSPINSYCIRSLFVEIPVIDGILSLCVYVHQIIRSFGSLISAGRSDSGEEANDGRHQVCQC